jgi:serine phosphatase RsbU (regulator of sigma subunit)
MAVGRRGADRRRSSPRPSFPLHLPSGELVERERRSGRDRRGEDLLAGLGLLRNAPRERVERLLEPCAVHTCAPREVVLQFGQANDHLYLILAGRLHIRFDSPDSTTGLVVGPGECFGEMSLIDDRQVSAWVVAQAGARVLLVPRQVFLHGLLSIPEVVHNLLHILSERMRARNELTVRALRDELALERLQGELEIARGIQASMLPTGFPLFPDRPELDLFALMDPARHVGGDFYDAFALDERRVLFAVGDVAGKGVPAALFMVRALTLLRGEAPRTRSLARMLARVNDRLGEGNPQGMFVTLFVAVLDAHSGELRYVSAGHPPPILVRAGGGVGCVPGTRGLLLGVVEAVAYAEGRLRLAPGDTLLAYTDGVTEAQDPAGAFFTEPRLQELAARHGPAGALSLVRALRAALTEFVATGEQQDDVTLLAVTYQGPPMPRRTGRSRPAAPRPAVRRRAGAPGAR